VFVLMKLLVGRKPVAMGGSVSGVCCLVVTARPLSSQGHMTMGHVRQAMKSA
jgi:hypothetical protein